MRVPNEMINIKNDHWNDDFANEIKSIEDRYPQSGLYQNDGSITPLWTVDWYAHGVLPCSDGKHLIRFGAWAPKHSQEALSFYAEGKLLSYYRIDQLVDFPALMPHSVSHFRWCGDCRLDEGEGQFRMRTLHGESFVFSLATGQIVESFRLPRWIVVFLALGLAYIIRRLWVNRKMTRRLRVRKRRTARQRRWWRR